MNITNLRFKIDELGCLLVSIDKGCTWENLGKVIGDGSIVPGPQGPEGPAGQNGADGIDGQDGKTPYINENGKWCIGKDTTVYYASGEKLILQILTSDDIANVGIPSVEIEDATPSKPEPNTKYYGLRFHNLKGEKGEAPEVTITSNVEHPNFFDIYIEGKGTTTIKQYTAGDNISIDEDGKISANVPYISTIPAKEHELIYADDLGNLLNRPLKIEDVEVVDTATDYAAMDTINDGVFKQAAAKWTRHHFAASDPVFGSTPIDYTNLETRVTLDNDRGIEPKYASINAWYGFDSNTAGKGVRLFNGEQTNEQQFDPLYEDTSTTTHPQYCFFNVNKHSTYSFLRSDKEYKRYYSLMVVGVDPTVTVPSQGESDNSDIITVPAQIITSNYLYQIEIHTGYHIVTAKEEGKSDTYHTFSIGLRRVPYPFEDSAGNGEMVYLVSPEEGLDIIPYDSAFDIASNLAACGLEMRLEDNVLYIGTAEKLSSNGDFDRTLAQDISLKAKIDFLHKTVTTYTNTTSVKDLYTAEMDEKVRSFLLEGLGALSGNFVHRAFMSGNNKSMWREILSVEKSVLLDFTPSSETVYFFEGSWVDQENDNPISYFTGSRIAFNSITNKLFYSDGVKAIRIATNFDSKLTFKSGTTTVTEYTPSSDASFTLKGTNGITLTPNSTNHEVEISYSEYDIQGGMGIKITKNIQNRSIVVANDAIPSILKSKTGIITSMIDPQGQTVTTKDGEPINGTQSGTQAYTWVAYFAPFPNSEYKVVNLKDFYRNTLLSPNSVVWEKTGSETGKYINLLTLTSSDGSILLSITTTEGSVVKQYYAGVLYDTPSDTSFTIITNLPWTVLASIGTSTDNTTLFAYLQVPDSFIGTINIVPIGYYKNSGLNVKIQKTISPATYVYLITGPEVIGTEYKGELLNSSDLMGSAPTVDIRLPFGKFPVDLFVDLPTASMVVGNTVFIENVSALCQIVSNQSATINDLISRVEALEQ